MNDVQKQTIKAIVNIFETGRISGDYGGRCRSSGDSGASFYGRSQATLGGGSLFSVLERILRSRRAGLVSPIRGLI